MKIYRSEQFIADKIKSSTTATLVCDKPVTVEKSTSKKEVRASQDIHSHLLYGSAILTSTVINGNDDVFLPKYTWEARSTIINTPFNNDHKSSHIIGHNTGYRILSEDGEVVDEGGDCPDYFDIEVDFVVYKNIHPEIAASIAEGFEDDTRFVSMECEISDFDYLLLNEEAEEVKIVARNEETAFLSRHLRAFGGDGKWNEYVIGRVLKDIIFIGMGSVGVPANSKSVYTKIVNANKAEVVNSVKSLYCLGRKGMYEFNDLEGAKKVISELQKEKAETQKQLDELKADKDEQVKAELTEIREKLQAEEKKVEEATESLETIKSEKEDLQKQLDEAQKSLEEAQATIKQAEQEKVTSERLAKLNELGVSYEDDDAKVKSIAAMDQTAFDAMVAAISVVADKKSDSVTVEENTDDKVTASVVNQSTDEDDTTQAVAKKLVASLRSRGRKSEGEGK